MKISKLLAGKGKKRRTSFFYFLLLIFVISLTDFLYFLSNYHFIDAFFSISTCFCAFLIPLYFFRNYLKLYTWLLLLVLLFVPFSLGGIVLFNLPVTDGLVLAIVNTTPREAIELLHNYVVLFVIVIIFLTAIYIYLLKRIPAKIPSKQGLIISACSLLLLFLLPFADIDKQSHPQYFQRLRGKIYSTFPFSIAYCSGLVYRQFHLISDTKKERDNFKFGATQNLLKDKKQLYILIIGESARYDHWQINGYPRNTSPKLSRRQNLVSFSNTVAGACFTEFAVPQIITLANPDNFEAHYKQRSILEAFKEAGFTTYWITDQFDLGHIKMHETDADYLYQHTLVPSKKITVNNTDMGLIASLKKALNDTVNKKFILIHTMGSHFDYSSRYLDEYDLFQPSLKTVFVHPNDYSKRNILINSYDNSILFSDSFIDSVIQLADDQNIYSSIYYISDHGENLFDDKQRLSLHAEVTPTIYTAHVPFFIWYSDSLKNAFPEKINWLIRHKDNKTSAENIVPTFTDMCNIHFALQDSTKCIDNQYFINSKQKLIGSGLVIYKYDSMLKH